MFKKFISCFFILFLVLASSLTALGAEIEEGQPEDILIADDSVVRASKFFAPDFDGYEDMKALIRDKLTEMLEKGETSFFITMTKDDLNHFGGAYWNVLFSNPELNYRLKFSYGVGSTYIIGEENMPQEYEVSPGFVDDVDPVLMEAALDKAERYCLGEVGDRLTDLEKVLLAHDYVADYCHYDNGEPDSAHNHDVYGALVARHPVCQGYAMAMQTLLNRMEVSAYLVTSDTMGHAWNMVEIDGRWLHLDAGWDDPTFVFNRNYAGRITHDYFLKTDEEFLNDLKPHYAWNTEYSLTSDQPLSHSFANTTIPAFLYGEYIWRVENNKLLAYPVGTNFAQVAETVTLAEYPVGATYDPDTHTLYYVTDLYYSAEIYALDMDTREETLLGETKNRRSGVSLNDTAEGRVVVATLFGAEEYIATVPSQRKSPVREAVEEVPAENLVLGMTVAADGTLTVEADTYRTGISLVVAGYDAAGRMRTLFVAEMKPGERVYTFNGGTKDMRYTIMQVTETGAPNCGAYYG